LGKIEKRKQTVGDEDQFCNIRLLLGDKLREIEDKEIVLVGTGSIGSNMAVALAGNGFRKYKLIDGDIVSRRNIPLCDAFSLPDVGRYKVSVLARFLRRKYGNRIQVSVYPVYVDKVPINEIIKPDMLVLGVDNNLTKMFVTYQRMQANKPMVILGFWGWEASYMLSIPAKTACWGCLFRPNSRAEIERIKQAQRCPEPEPNVPGAVIRGTVGRVVGVAANEITKFMLGEGRVIQYYHFNALTEEKVVRFLDSNHLRPDEQCPICKKEVGIDAADLRKHTNG